MHDEGLSWFDVTHVEKVADGWPVSEPVSKVTLCAHFWALLRYLATCLLILAAMITDMSIHFEQRQVTGRYMKRNNVNTIMEGKHFKRY